MPVIETSSLTKRFGKKVALDQLTLAVEPGTILGLLGPNGAGKTTTLRILTDILRPSGGEARVFGVPSSKMGRREFERLGYVSENQKLPGWMTVQQLLDYLRPLYPTWDEPFCQHLLKTFDLPTNQKVRTLSRGMKMKAALISSLSYRPEVLILDEPFSGLDPVVRHDLIEGLIEFTTAEKWTVLLASHDIDEVERLSDKVAIIDYGKLLLHEDLGQLCARFRHVAVTFEDENAAVQASLSKTWLQPKAAGRCLEFVDSASNNGMTEAALRERLPQAVSVEAKPMALEAIYLAMARHARSQQTLKS
jgi:ABC-2 type transport system ATP-binding protein